MKKILAHGIQTAVTVFTVWVIGSTVRGPFADDSIPRDLAVGAGLVGAVATVEWSRRELEKKS